MKVADPWASAAVMKRITDIGQKFVGVGSPLQTSTLVFGGLGESMEEATEWITTKLKGLGANTMPTIYHKGDEFRGVAFAKYASVPDAAKALSSWEQSRHQYKGQDVWCNEDRPLTQRVCVSFLLGLRRQLCLWGTAEKSAVKVDANACTLTFGDKDKVVASAAVNKDRLSIQWIDQTWETWEELQQAPELKKLFEVANSRLAEAVKRRAKGIGKGKTSQ